MRTFQTMAVLAAATLASCGTTGAVLGPSIAELDTRWAELDLFFDT